MDIAKMTAVELGRKIKTKEISVREAVEAVFDRIKSVEGEYNCYVTLCEEQALKKAEEIQKKIDDGTLTGPLAGVPVAIKDNMRVRILGRRDELAQDIVDKIDELEEATKNNTGLNFQIALNYGSRDEITRAVRELTKECIEKGIDPDTITEDMISAHLDTRDIPDPDFLIRTSGEKRISNYLLWQCAYSEFDFPEVLWPDFNMDYLIEEIRKYNKRDRRFGGVKEE